MTAVILPLLVAAFGGYWLWRGVAKARRREALLASPLPPAQKAIVETRIPLYAALPAELRRKLDGLINRFLSEMTILGQGGLEMTDEIRLTIAAQACLLIVNKENRWYDSLHTILVYPGAFKSKITDDHHGVVMERDEVRAGESWDRGPVVLSWDNAAYGAFIPHDGQNVVLHEFAHQLDQQTGVTDGAPLLDRDHDARQWAEVLSEAYDRLAEDVSAGRETFLDPYGASAPAEFFAVATEYFFEKPHAMREAEPALYEELSKYYRLDPAELF